MTTLCLCDVNEHDLQVFAEIAAAGRRPAQHGASDVSDAPSGDAMTLPAARLASAPAGAPA